MPPRLPRAVRAATQYPEPTWLKPFLQGVSGVLGFAALAVLFDYKSIRGFRDEQDFAIAMQQEGRTPKPHRCNDRVEDFCQVFAGNGSIWSQGTGSLRVMFQCLASKPGQEPTEPYFVLHPGDPHYRDHGQRQGNAGTGITQ